MFTITKKVRTLEYFILWTPYPTVSGCLVSNYLMIQCMVCFYVVFLSYQMQDLLIEISVFHKVYLGSKRPKEAVEFMRWHPIINQSMQEKEKKKQSLWFCCWRNILFSCQQQKSQIPFVPLEKTVVGLNGSNCSWFMSQLVLVQQLQSSVCLKRGLFCTIILASLHPYFFQMTNVCHSKPSNYFLALEETRCWLPSIF